MHESDDSNFAERYGMQANDEDHKCGNANAADTVSRSRSGGLILRRRLFSFSLLKMRACVDYVKYAHEANTSGLVYRCIQLLWFRP